MIIDEKYLKDSENRERLFSIVSCDCCEKVFSRQKRQLSLHACDSSCRAVLKGQAQRLSCDHCGTYFNRSLTKIKQSKSGKHFCSRQCKDIGQTYIKEIQPDHYGRGEDYRKLAFQNYPSKCNRCGYDANIKGLDVHHKDHNRSNNDISNLEIICCICHAIEHR